MYSSWNKAAAYNIVFYCAMFGGYQYYLNQQLLFQVKRTEVVRYILSVDPTNKAMIEKTIVSWDRKAFAKAYKVYTPSFLS